MHTIARSFDERAADLNKDRHHHQRDDRDQPPDVGRRPGDILNERASWESILSPHGWVRIGISGGTTLWRRPGKQHGVSATTGHAGADLLYVFSSNASPFEPGNSYDKFAALTALEYHGDFAAAARDLREWCRG
jgi:hypothetical protein